MRRISSIIIAVAILAAVPVIANPVQDDQGPAQYVYEAYYKINYADLAEWTESFYEHSVPILNDLREEGVLQGWSMYNHYTAGDYNVRFTARTRDWNALRQFWDEYLPRLAERAPTASARSAEMIVAHYDEIWDISHVNVPAADGPYRYMVSSSFRVNFSDVDEWNSVWSGHMAPALDQAIEDGLLAGWATLEHNTGASENWRVLYFFEDWDNIDDLFERIYYANDPEAVGRLDRMLVAHNDQIWTATVAPETSEAGAGR